jgi:hypothetical protein
MMPTSTVIIIIERRNDASANISDNRTEPVSNNKS